MIAAAGLPVNPLAVIFSSVDVYYMITRIANEGWDEATDSDRDKLLLGAGISALCAILASLTAAGVALASGGTAAAWYGPCAAAAGVFGLVSVALNLTVFVGSVTNQFAPDPINEDKKPSNKPTAKPATKPVNKPTTPSKPQPTQPPKPLKPANPEKEYGGDW